jgi:hypothetical protein
MKKILQDIDGKAEEAPVGGHIWNFTILATTI